MIFRKQKTNRHFMRYPLSAWFLFFLGMVIQFLGILIAHSESIGPIDKYVFADSHRMEHGFDVLANLGQLTKGSEGFEEISEFIIDEIMKEPPIALEKTYLEVPQLRKIVKSKEIRYLKGMGIPSNTGGIAVGKLNNEVEVSYGGGQTDIFRVYMYRVEEGIGEYRKRNSLVWALIFFIFASCIQVFAAKRNRPV